MEHKTTALERAFQIARSGHAASVEEIRTALKKEGYLSSQVEGPHLSRQLRAIIKTAREGKIL